MHNQKRFDEQVKKLHQEVIELIKKYQFRDRNQMVCCGLSVSQCYILETLRRYGSLTMKSLAEKMHLSISTITRVLEPLVRKGYVERTEDPDDRRIRHISLSNSGKQVYQQSWENVIRSEKIILEHFPPEHRDLLIELLQKLNKAVSYWQSCCSPGV
jgi:DNA-binding MarR family transcriptional regulator